MQFLLRYRELGTSQWSSNRQLPKTPLYALIQNLKGFTAYEVSMAAKNDRGTGPWAQKTGVTGESGTHFMFFAVFCYKIKTALIFF